MVWDRSTVVHSRRVVGYLPGDVEQVKVNLLVSKGLNDKEYFVQLWSDQKGGPSFRLSVGGRLAPLPSFLPSPWGSECRL